MNLFTCTRVSKSKHWRFKFIYEAAFEPLKTEEDGNNDYLFEFITDICTEEFRIQTNDDRFIPGSVYSLEIRLRDED